MQNVLVKEKNVFNYLQTVICPVELDYTYELLNPSDKKAMVGAAECLAETFAGIEVDGVRVSEPMVNACSLSKDDMFEFVLGYLENVVHQRLCYVAKDKKTGDVIGTLACEDFNPNEEIPEFQGRLAPMNTVMSFLAELDERFVNTIQRKTGKPVTTNQYVHTFMAGVKLGTLKRFVIIKLFDLLIKDARARGYKGMFGEATNFRSIKMMTKYCGFHPVYDLSNNPIQSVYAENEVFKVIPLDIATDCRILYRPYSLEYEL